MLHDGCATAMYARPLSSHSLEEDSLVSFIYINLTPLLYPAIYTLQNRDVQGALQRVVGPRTPGALHQADVTECWMPGGVCSEISPPPPNGNLTFQNHL
eukprot:bmy_12831T0